jgi:hypothetical protein
MQEEWDLGSQQNPEISSTKDEPPSDGINHTESNTQRVFAQNVENKPGCSCGSQSIKMASPPSYVYAMGKVTYRFPNKSIELELA